MTRPYIFADDSMQGREAGTIGNVKGTDYIASEVKRLGLQPAGDSGSYFQTIPFKTRTLDPASTVSVGGAPMAVGTEWAAISQDSASGTDVPTVFGGTLGDSASIISPEQVAGKVVVFAFGPNSGRTGPSVAKVAMNAVAIGLILPPQFLSFVARPQQFVDNPGATPPGASKATIYLTPMSATKLFDDPVAQLKSGTAGKAISFTVHSRVEPVPFPARNVVAILPGSDPKLKGEYVAIGAHNDHIGFNHAPVDHDSIRSRSIASFGPSGAENRPRNRRDAAGRSQRAPADSAFAQRRHAARPDSIYNGADDDGSGSVSVLEIAEEFAMRRSPKPKRSMLFVWHVGEEEGLLGSAWFTDHPDGAARLDRRAAQHRHGRPRRRERTSPARPRKARRSTATRTTCSSSDRDVCRPSSAICVEKVNHEGEARILVRLRDRRERTSAEHLLPERSLRVRALRHPDRVLHDRRTRGLPPGDRRAGVHRLRSHGEGATASSAISWCVSRTSIIESSSIIRNRIRWRPANSRCTSRSMA